jgi:thiol-disulfide isomerase/thioredoxin
MKKIAIAGFVAIVVLAAGATAAYQNKKARVPFDEQVLKQMGIAKGDELVFRDAKKTEIDRVAFFNAVSHGAVFQKVQSGRKVTLTLKAESETRRLDETIPALHIGRGYKLKRDEYFPTDGLKTLSGAAFDRASAAHKYTLVNFYYADCAPCVHEAQELSAFAAANPQIRTVAITYDDAEVSKRFVASTGLTWTVLPNAKATLAALGVQSYPAFALLDKDGKLKAMGNHIELGFSPGGLDAWMKRAMAAN